MDEKTERMYFIGDTHTVGELPRILEKHKLTDSNLIHVGDFGLGELSIMQEVKNLQTIDEILLETNNQLYVIRGNHDNPIFWNKSLGLNLPKLHNLHLVDDYSVINVEDKNILCVGGAISLDRIPRSRDIPYPSWWRGEEFVYNPYRLDQAIAKGRVIDIVVTHTAPHFCYPLSGSKSQLVDHYDAIETSHGNNLKLELELERSAVTELHDDLTIHHKQTPTHWLYGHFHRSNVKKINNTNFVLLNINEVYKL